jgi:single-stranded DNA-binding protein
MITVSIIGTLVNDAITRVSKKNNKEFAVFTVASERDHYKTKLIEYINCTIFNDQTLKSPIIQHLTKDKVVNVVGQLNFFNDKEGKKKASVIVDRVNFINVSSGNQFKQYIPPISTPTPAPTAEVEEDGDEVTVSIDEAA